MTRRTLPTAHDDQNYDSFLDIVANLVGILVILIMVVGVRARHVAQSTKKPNSSGSVSPTSTPPPPVQSITTKPPTSPDWSKIQSLKKTLREQAKRKMDLERDNFALDDQIKNLAHHTQRQQAARNQLQLAVSLAEKALKERQSELATKEQMAISLATNVDQTRQQLQQILRQASAVESAKPKEGIIEHRPTPLAKTVFGNEEHFRITDGRIVHVPLNEVTEIMRRDAKTKIWKLAKANRFTEVIGPVNGFRVKYTVEKRKGIVQTPEGPRTVTSAELNKLDMIPESDDLGEPIEVAIQPGSEFTARLNGLHPNDTTVTLWVYPDGFAHFRQVRHLLQQRGFLSAARPMEFGFLIGGSPNGTKSAAE